MSGEYVDDLQLNNLTILQREGSFKFGIDAVLLSDFIAEYSEGGSRSLKKYLDIGTGTGILPILLSAKTDIGHITGIEIQKSMADMAQRSVHMNKLTSLINIICDDIKNRKNHFTANEFDGIITNPPYIKIGCGLINPSAEKAVARHEIMCTLEDIISISYELLKPKGNFFMVHRPDRLTDIISTLRKYRLEPKVLQFVHPSITEQPTMILIAATKDGNTHLKVLPPQRIN